MTKPKLVIFDMGNTLLNFHAGIHSDDEKDLLGLGYMSAYLLSEFAVNISPQTLETNFLKPWLEDFYIREQGLELDVTHYLEPILSQNKIRLTEKNYVDLMSEFYKTYREEVVVSENAKEILKSLHKKGVKIAVASNCILFDEIYESIFREQGLSEYIDKFVFSYSRGIRKPDRRLFEEIIAYFNFEPSEIIMVGDSLKADIVPAKALGMKTIWLNKKNQSSENEFADVEIKAFEDLMLLHEFENR